MTTASVDNMTNAANRDFGAKLTYDPSWTGPLNAKRKITNIPSIVAFFLCVGAWIGVTAYVLSSADVGKANDILKEMKEYLTEQKWTYLAVMVSLFCLSILFLVLLRVAPKSMARISSVFNIVVFVLLILALIILLFSDYSIDETSTAETSPYDLSTILAPVGIPVLIVALILSIRIKIRNSKLIPVSCEIIRESCKIILSFPSIIAYAVVNIILFNVLYILWKISMAFTYFLYDFENDDLPAHVGICRGVSYIVYVWINMFLFEMFRVTVAGTYGTWYWTENKREVPRFTALRFIYILIRYHIGPVALGSLIMPFCCIPRFFVWFVASGLGIDCSSSGNRVARLFQRCFNCCHSACYGVVKKFTGMSFVQVALHGDTGFVDASRASLGLRQRNHTKVAAIGQIVLILYVAGFTVITLLFVGILVLLRNEEDIINEQGSTYVDSVIMYPLFIIILVIFKLLGIAVDTILMCGLEDLEMNGGKSRFMSNNLKNLLM